LNNGAAVADHAQRTLIVGIKGSYDDYCELPQQNYGDAALNSPG